MFHTVTYDDSKRFITNTSTSPATTTNSYAYNVWGNLLAETDETNPMAMLTTSHTYDNWGRETAATFPDGRKNFYTMGRGDSVDKNYFTITHGTGQPWIKTWYDAVGRETSTETIGANNMAISTTNTYDHSGQITQIETKQGDLTQTDRYEYDSFGRMVKETKNSGQVISHVHGNRSITTTTNGRSHTKTVDAWGNVKTAGDPGGLITYTYYSNGKPKSITMSGVTVATMKYDAVGNQTELVDPNAGRTTYEYNALGQLTKQQDARGNVTENRYDALNRLETSLLNGTRTNYTYGTSGYDNLLLTRLQRNEQIITYQHDRLGRVAKEARYIDGNPINVEYEYDANTGQLARESLSNISSSAKYAYDTYGNLKKVSTDDETIWELVANSGTQTMVKLANGAITRTTTLNAQGFLSNQQTRIGNREFLNLNYSFDQLTGNMTYRSGVNPNPEHFVYDNLDRLTSATEEMITGPVSTSYLPNGNIRNKTGIGQYYYEVGKPHAVTGIDNTDGLVPNETQQITYNAFNSAETITETVGDDIYELKITYGPDQQRWKSVLKKNEQIVKTIIFAPGYERVTDENGVIKHFYYISGGDGLVAVLVKERGQTDKTYYAHTDHLGSILKLTDKAGKVAFAAGYDAWGNQTIYDATLAFHRGYTGHEHLPEFGLINMNGRMYDPVLGRMLSPDNYVASPLYSQDFNRYTYARNNPLSYVDPDGEFINLVAAAFIGGMINWVANGSSSPQQGLAYFGVGAIAGAASAGVGAGISSLMAGSAFGAGFIGASSAMTAYSSFYTGATIGFSSGLVGGFVTGFGNGLVGGQNLSFALGSGIRDGLIGGLSGGLLGGLGGGIDAAIDGRNFWNGSRPNDYFSIGSSGGSTRGGIRKTKRYDEIDFGVNDIGDFGATGDFENCVPLSLTEANRTLGGTMTYADAKLISGYKGKAINLSPAQYQDLLSRGEISAKFISVELVRDMRHVSSVQRGGGLISTFQRSPGHVDIIRSIRYYHNGNIQLFLRNGIYRLSNIDYFFLLQVCTGLN